MQIECLTLEISTRPEKIKKSHSHIIFQIAHVALLTKAFEMNLAEA